MKKTILIFIIHLFFCFELIAQNDTIEMDKLNNKIFIDTLIKRNNSFSISIIDLCLFNLNIHYERCLNKNFSIGSSINYYLNSIIFFPNDYSFEVVPRMYLNKKSRGYFLSLGYKFTHYTVSQEKEIYSIDSIYNGNNYGKIYDYHNIDTDNYSEPTFIQKYDQRIVIGAGFKDYLGKKQRLMLECSINYGIPFTVFDSNIPKTEHEYYDNGQSKYIINHAKYYYLTDGINSRYFLNKDGTIVFRVKIGYSF